MHVYVVFGDYGDDGCSEPLDVFASRESAESCCEKMRQERGYDVYSFVELELSN